MGRIMGSPAVTFIALVTAAALEGSALTAPANAVSVPAATEHEPTGTARVPARVCGNDDLLSGPTRPPRGAVRVPAGDNRKLSPEPDTTYWFAPGVHTFGRGEFGQIIPADHTTFVGAPGAILDGRHTNRYAFTQHAVGVRIEHLTIRRFGAIGGNHNEGVVNHDAGRRWTIHFNTIRGNAGAGVFIGSGNNVSHNCLSRNGQYGFSAYARHGVHNIRLHRNEISLNNTYDWERRIRGCGCTGGGKFWDVDGATVTANWSHDNNGPGFWADTNNNDFLFEGNRIARNDGPGIEYETSYNAMIRDNVFVRNGLIYGRGNPGFPTGAIYLSESGGDSRVEARYKNITVTRNRFRDNWSGVVLWENADRFCGSPANTSSGYCTLVNPSRVNLETCVSTRIEQQPYYSGCRWKTKKVQVRSNMFTFHRSHIRGCTVAASCGLQGLFSNWGTYPSWSPYKRDRIQRAITFRQHNVFTRNTYRGRWRFMVHGQDTVLRFEAWRAAPYNQDARSTVRRS